jgi:hypothetical protein
MSIERERTGIAAKSTADWRGLSESAMAIAPTRTARMIAVSAH